MKNILAAVLCIFAGLIYAQQGTYSNPVIAGDFPDPSVIRVGNIYYAAGTSSEWAPPYRLFSSTDLINWKYVGPLFKTMPEWTMGSFWAPELFYHNNKYFVYYTARRKSDKRSFIGLASAKDLSQGFEDHGLIIEWTNEAIDAFVVEVDGKLYITWKAYGLDPGRNIEIIGSELSADGLSLVGESFCLLTAETDTWERGGIEGQSIIKHGDYLYMFYAGNACCGANCDYMTGVARSKSIKGPWERYSDNPILKSGGDWKCPGHGSFLETSDNRYFYFYHAYHNSTGVYTGREGLIDEIIWQNGWPMFKNGTTPTSNASAPYTSTIQAKPEKVICEKFKGNQLNLPWIRDVSANKKYKVSKHLELSPPALFALRPTSGSYTISATFSASDTAGVCLYGDANNNVSFALINGVPEAFATIDGKIEKIETSDIKTNKKLTLCLTVKDGRYCQFGYILSPNAKTPIITMEQQFDAVQIPRWDRPPMVGIFCKGLKPAKFYEIKIEYQ